MARNNFTVVVLNKFPELGKRFDESLRSTHDPVPPVVVVCDNHDGSAIGASDVTCIGSYGTFVFAKNCNIGFMVAEPNDVILCNDDVTFPQKNTLHLLAEYAQRRPNVGIAAPLVDGGIGCPQQDYSRVQEFFCPGQTDYEVRGRRHDAPPICFVCVYIKRRCLNQTGPMDEQFIHYGYDDNDYSIRARIEGWRTMVFGLCHVKHGQGGAEAVRGMNWSSTYSRTKDLLSNHEIFIKKRAPKKLIDSLNATSVKSS